MIDSDLNIVSSGIPQYSNNPSNTGKTDDVQKQAHPDFSEVDPFFYLYGKNFKYAITQQDPQIEIISKKDNKDLQEKSLEEADKDIPMPTLSNISDSEIRLLATKLISDMKVSGKEMDMLAIINSIMINFGLKDDEQSRKAVISRLKDVLSKKRGNNISDSLNEDNQALLDKKCAVPIRIIDNIKSLLSNPYIKRKNPKWTIFAKRLVKDPYISYQNAKRKLGMLKKMSKGQSNTYKFKLYGGNDMLTFLDGQLKAWSEMSKAGHDAVSKATIKNGHKKPSMMPSMPKITESTEFHPNSFIGYTDKPYIETVDMSKLSLNALKSLTIDHLIPNLKKYSTPTMMQLSQSIEQTSPKNVMDLAKTLSDIDVCITKFSDKGKYKVFAPSICKVCDLGNGLMMLCTRNVNLQFDDSIDEMLENTPKPKYRLFDISLNRIPTKEEILTIGDRRFTPEEALKKVQYIIVGKSVRTKETHQMIIDTLNKIIEIYPDRYEWKVALDMTN